MDVRQSIGQEMGAYLTAATFYEYRWLITMGGKIKGNATCLDGNLFIHYCTFEYMAVLENKQINESQHKRGERGRERGREILSSGKNTRVWLKI